MSKSTSGAPKKKCSSDANYELEQQFILRMPPEAAEELRNEVVIGSAALSHNISIEMLPDGRRALIRYGHYIYNAKLVDLPCIIESLKTTDRKTFFKTADICQMLVCTEEDDSGADAMETLKKKEREKKYSWNHGITHPLKNVRKRRFRKTLTKKYNEQPDIEKEVRQLFRMDSEAIDVKWEVIAEESNQGQSPGHDTSQSMELGGSAETTQYSSVAASASLADIDLFGELSSSEEDEKDVNVLDSGEEESTSAQNSQPVQGGGMGGVDGEGSKDNEMLAMKIEDIKGDLESLRNERMEQEIQMATIDNPALKQHFQEMLDKLIDEENQKEIQYQMLLSMTDNG